MTELIEFWRVENSYGEGPYNCERTPKPLKYLTDLSKHPYPSDDGLDFHYSVLKQHYFGFRSEQQLREWFVDELLQKLAEKDDEWLIVKYMVDERLAYHGLRQSIVLKGEIEGRYSPNTWAVRDYLDAKQELPDLPVGAPPLEDLPDPITPGADDA